jgi:hypothetical protein
MRSLVLHEIVFADWRLSDWYRDGWETKVMDKRQ